MATITFKAQKNTYLYPPDTGAPGTQEEGATLMLEWDCETGVDQQTSALLAVTWTLPTETWHLNGTGTVTQNGYNFDFVAEVGPQPITLRGKLAVSFPVREERREERIAALAAIYEGEGLSALVAFGVVTGDLAGIAPF